MLDVLQVVFWSITYGLIIIAGFQSRKIRKVSIPYFAVILNYSWECCALLHSYGWFWAHIVWFSLDLIIVIIGYLFLDTKKEKISFILLNLTGIVLLFFVFQSPGGMLISCFIIDFLMAASFLICRKKLSPKFKIVIAVTKLIGDSFAGLFYSPNSYVVGFLACLVFICNIIYLELCIEEKGTSKTSQVTALP